jgi:pimeloyl-ACP methyl ester carboxylesterase
MWRLGCRNHRRAVRFASLITRAGKAKSVASLLVGGIFALATLAGLWGGANASANGLWRYWAETPATPEPAWELARETAYPALPERPAYTVYWPEGPAGPKPVVIALHGIGGSGPGMATMLLTQARANGWVLVAPTIPYGDWRDPNQLTGEELRLLPQIASLIDYVRDEAGVESNGRVMLFGFSRGAQAALRFSMLYPERVDAVAAFSAGTYTLPVRSIATANGPALVKMPFGIADLPELSGRSVDQVRLTGVRFLIGVGATDTNNGDVPRQWDTYVGRNRVERATKFASVLAELGCETSLSVVPGTGHELNLAVMEQVTGFLATSAARSRMEGVMGIFSSAGYNVK